jgi:GLPGLI family protein
MKKLNFLIIIILILISTKIRAQNIAQVNIIYEFRYVRDLSNKDNIYKSNMVLSVAKNKSRYCTEKIFNDNDEKILESRKKEQDQLQSTFSTTLTSVSGGPILSIGKSGVLINEEIIKNIEENKIYIETKIGLKTYKIENTLQEIKWTVFPEMKKIGNYECQKASSYFGGRNYEVWFTKELPFQDGPWKLHGLPGLILEAYDTNKEICFYFKEIVKKENVDITIRSFLNSPYSISTNIEDLNRIKKAFEIDPEGVIISQAPNARIYIKNIDNPTEKSVYKVKKYNPMELK